MFYIYSKQYKLDEVRWGSLPATQRKRKRERKLMIETATLYQILSLYKTIKTHIYVILALYLAHIRFRRTEFPA